MRCRSTARIPPDGSMPFEPVESCGGRLLTSFAELLGGKPDVTFISERESLSACRDKSLCDRFRYTVLTPSAR